jgi:hypothetical protein
LKQAPTVWHGLQQISPRFLDEEGLVHSLFSSDSGFRFFRMDSHRCASHRGKMDDDKRAVNTEASLRNGTSQPRVGVGVFAS